MMVVDAERRAAAVQKLQANSRGMLARRNFGRIKRQTLAMIVIQRTLVRRNRRNRHRGQGIRPPPAAHDSAAVAAFAPSRTNPLVVQQQQHAPPPLPSLLMQQQQQQQPAIAAATAAAAAAAALAGTR